MNKNSTAPPRYGQRYQLVVYQHVIDQWWPTMIVLGVVLLIVCWLLSQHPLGQAEPWRATGMLFLGVAVLAFGILLAAIRKSAYVQPSEGYLRVVTPLLRMNISYKRIRRTFTAEMGGLFPPNKAKGWQREVLRPVSSWTAIVIELSDLPFSRRFLELFLSPLFFADKAPQIVILVRDWMNFSMEMESLRTPGGAARPRTYASRITSGLLSNLKKDSKK